MKSRILLLIIVLGIFSNSNAQFFPKNDTTASFVVKSNGYGVIYSYDYKNGETGVSDLMIDRVQPIIGVDESYVWNPNDDPEDAALIDTVLYLNSDSTAYRRYVRMNNAFRTSAPFAMNVAYSVYLYENSNFALVRFDVKNASEESREFYLSTLLRPRIKRNFGGETVEYNSDNKTLYAYKSEGAIGITSLDREFSGVSTLDFSDYDATAPARDNARDANRWAEVTKTSFPDQNLSASDDGSYNYLNYGSSGSILAGDSVSYWVAFTHGLDLDEVDARLDSARVKYSEMTTSISEKVDEKPVSVELSQNFPNPFNPSTTIQFSVPTAQHITLEVFNVLGQKVATLVDGVQQAGVTTVKFDAARLSTGMYLYRLSANGESVVRKMSLIK